VSCAEMAEPIDLPFGLWMLCRRKYTFNRIRQVAPMCLPSGHIGATWQIRLNRPSAAVMPSYIKLLWPLVGLQIAMYSLLSSLLWCCYLGHKDQGGYMVCKNTCATYSQSFSSEKVGRK